MGSVTGLSATHRSHARRRVREAALLAYHHKDSVHYTQTAARWNGIAAHKDASKGQYPTQADCSAFATWCIWNGIYLPYHCRDTVNGAKWLAGFTGTMLHHGKRVVHVGNTLVGDCVIYGGGTGKHTAVIVAHATINGRRTPMVVSHGSDAGPFYLPYNYRPDINQIRRYI